MSDDTVQKIIEEDFNKFRDYASTRTDADVKLSEEVEKLKKDLEDNGHSPPADFVDQAVAHHTSLVGSLPATYEADMKAFALSLVP